MIFMKQNSKELKFEKSLVKSKMSCQKSFTSYLFLGIIFSISLITMTPIALADSHITINIESNDTCENSSCLSEDGLSIKRNSSVTWKNNDLSPHVILSGTQDSGRDGIFESGTIFPGEEYSFTFVNEGYYQYYCNIHPWITGMILVNP